MSGLSSHLGQRLPVPRPTSPRGCRVEFGDDTCTLTWGSRLPLAVSTEALHIDDPASVDSVLEAIAKSSLTVQEIPELIAAVWGQGDAVDRAYDLWRVSVMLIEAAHRDLVARLRSGDPSAAAHLALAARSRFVLASAPFRFDDEELRGHALSLYEVDFDAEALTAFAADTRASWARHLLRAEDLPDLTPVAGGGEWIETEAQWLLFRDPGKARLLEIALLSSEGTTNPPDDSRFPTWFGREFLTRRFMMISLWRTVARLPRVLMLVGAIGLLGSLGLGLQGSWGETVIEGQAVWEWGMRGSMLVLYGTVLLSGLAAEANTYPAALRFGASAFIGVALLLNVSPAWHAAVNTRQAWLIAGGCLFVSLAYLVIEARLHGVPAAKLMRAPLVLAIGLTHGVAAGYVLVEWLAPLFLSGWPAELQPMQAARAVLVSGSVAVTAGVFLQILWEDRPVTYPLSAMPLSGGSRS